MIPRPNRIPRMHMNLCLRGRSIMGNLGRIVISQSFDETSHLAVIVPKKVMKTSVGRHRIKRRVQAAFSGLLEVGKPISMVIFPTKAVLDTPFEEILAWCEEIRNKISS